MAIFWRKKTDRNTAAMRQLRNQQKSLHVSDLRSQDRAMLGVKIGRLGTRRLGFPLHPAGRPSDERGSHLFEVKIPMLFLQGTRDVLADTNLSFPKIISGRIGGAVQPGSEWRQWRQIVGLLDARAHLSVMPSACTRDCNTAHKRKEFVAGAPRRRSALDPGTRGAMCRSDVLHSHSALVIQERSVDRGYPSPSPET